ncbi:MAG: porin family protein [Bacteroidales bacterium]|jgi:hypothetical protein
MAFIRLFVLITILHFLQLNTRSQEIAYGLKAGADCGTPYSKPQAGDSGKVGIGPVFGAFISYTFSKFFSVHAELSCSYNNASFGTNISGDTLYAETIAGKTYYIPTHYSGRVKGTFKNCYLDFPVFLAYKISEKFTLLAGPQLSYLFKGKNSGTADISVGTNPKYPFKVVNNAPFDESNELNKWDYSIAAGTAFEATKRLFFNLTGSVGLRSIYKKSYTQAAKTVRNIYLQLSTAFRIGRIKDNTVPDNKTP